MHLDFYLIDSGDDEWARLLQEAKSTITFPELMAGTRITDSKQFNSGLSMRVTDAPAEESSEYMKMIQFIGNVDGYKPRIVFFDYDSTRNTRTVVGNPFAGLGGRSPDIDAVQPVRVACSCEHYKILYSSPNKAADVHWGHLPNSKLDPRDYGYNKNPNPDEVPGACEHLIGLYRYLVASSRVAE